MHPRSRRWYQLDHVIIRRHQLRGLKQCRSLHSADCGLRNWSRPGSLQASNHTEKVLSNLTKALAPCRRLLYTQLSPQSALSTAAISWTGQCNLTRWSKRTTRDVIISSALEAYGHQSKAQPGWFRDNADLLPAVAAKRSDILKVTVRNSRFAHSELQAAKRTVQHLTHFAVSRYGEYLSTRIQHCADCGDFHGLYSGIREVIGPFAKKVSPLLTADGALLVDTQARNQLGTPRVAKSFLRGAHIFQIMSNNFQLCPTDFSLQGGENVWGGGFDPLSPWLRTCVQ